MEDAGLDRAPIWDDLSTFPCELYRGRVDLITAGFPCQPASIAGSHRGTSDERWIWPLIADIIRRVEPGIVFLENVPGLLSVDRGHAYRGVLESLAELGFDAEWSLLRASDVGAPHRRERLFVLGYTDRARWPTPDRSALDAGRELGAGREPLADALRVAGSEVTRSTHGDESSHAGWAEKHGDEPDRRVEGLADAGHGFLPLEGRGSEGRAGARSAGEELADADRGGREVERLGGILDRERAALGNAADRSDRERSGIAGMGDANSEGLEGRREPERGSADKWSAWPPSPTDTLGWERWIAAGGAEPAVCRGVDGIPDRMDRLRCLGNAVVPAQAELAFRGLVKRATARAGAV
jgi:DNA (cytosine-5)-methyltransferase 1